MYCLFSIVCPASGGSNDPSFSCALKLGLGMTFPSQSNNASYTSAELTTNDISEPTSGAGHRKGIAGGAPDRINILVARIAITNAVTFANNAGLVKAPITSPSVMSCHVPSLPIRLSGSSISAAMGYGVIEKSKLKSRPRKIS
jgi:hypothetical protein